MNEWHDHCHFSAVDAECGSKVDLPLRFLDHITDALENLHWLRVSERVVYKTAVLVCKVPHKQAPHYLGPLTRVADLLGRRAFRSASISHLSAAGSSQLLNLKSRTTYKNMSLLRTLFTPFAAN